MSPEPEFASRVHTLEKQLFSSPAKRTFIYSLLLVLLVLALYNPVAHNGFINLDDNLYITDNVNVKAGLHWATVKWSFVTFDQANWHPLTWLGFIVDWQLYKKSPGGHHYTSVVFHAIDVVLLFLLFQSATGYRWRSLMIAALFAVHPSNVESIAWISELKNPLSMAFFLLAMLAYGRYVRQPSIRGYLLVPVLFALGLMAKPQIITLPFVLLLWDYWPLRRFGSSGDPASARPAAPARLSRVLLEKVPLLLIAAADAVATMHAQRVGSAMRTLGEYSLSLRLANAIVSYARYVGHAVWPYHLSPVYSHPSFIPAWQSVLALLFLLCLTSVILMARKPYLLTGWLWFLGTMVPMIGIIQVGDQAMAERYAYIPFIGLFWMGTWLVAEAAPTWHVDDKWLAIAACLLIGSCCVLTHQLLVYWHDSETLWNYAIRVDDQDSMAHANLARILVAENRPKEAIPEFIIAERLHRYPISNIVALAGYELEHGYIDDAKAHCLDILQRTNDPRDRAVALNDLGVADLTLGDLTQAKLHFNEAVNAEPKAAGAIIGLGLVAYRQGDVNAAIDYFSQAVRLEPNSDLGHFFLAVAYQKNGREAEARSAYAIAQKVSPNLKYMFNWASQLLADPEITPAGPSKLHFVAGQ